MIPGLTPEAITEAMRLLEEEGPMREANELVVQFLHRHAVVKTWGEGTRASADAMSLDASRHLWNARVDPRRRTYAMGIYAHVLDQWGIIYDGCPSHTDEFPTAFQRILTFHNTLNAMFLK